jgi:hypothetical protein
LLLQRAGVPLQIDKHPVPPDEQWEGPQQDVHGDLQQDEKRLQGQGCVGARQEAGGGLLPAPHRPRQGHQEAPEEEAGEGRFEGLPEGEGLDREEARHHQVPGQHDHPGQQA